MKNMRRHDRQLTAEQATLILKQNNYGILSLVLPDGSPYGVPINYGFCDNQIIMHAALAGQKLDAIKHCASACFTVVHKSDVDLPNLTTHYASVIAFGQVTLEEDEVKKRAYLIKLLDHYQVTEEMAKETLDKTTKRTAVLVMDIKEMTAKGHPEAVVAV
jgi:nitroimidazol reductase NimA-like FMN-containing flavoprotein (pyridoxamine 5'-phosphate oxidase superfamily)